jgi:hypothetical protein
MKAGHAEALRVGGSFSGGGSHPAKAEAPKETRAVAKQRAFFCFQRLPDTGISPLFGLLIHHLAG